MARESLSELDVVHINVVVGFLACELDRVIFLLATKRAKRNVAVCDKLARFGLGILVDYISSAVLKVAKANENHVANRDPNSSPHATTNDAPSSLSIEAERLDLAITKQAGNPCIGLAFGLQQKRAQRVLCIGPITSLARHFVCCVQKQNNAYLGAGRTDVRDG